MRHRTLGWTTFLATLLLSLPGVASATTFNFTSGSILVTATVLGSPVASGTILLDGDFFAFDPGIPQTVDLEFTATAQGPFALTLPGAFPDFDTITIDTLSIVPGVLTVNTAAGSNPYTIALRPLIASGTASLTDTDSPFLTPIAGAPFSVINNTLSGTVNIASGTLTLTGVEIGSIDFDGPGPGGPLPPVVLKGDVIFTGVVPEPATALLLAAGLCGLAAARRRRPA
jgi:hypothetical protein